MKQQLLLIEDDTFIRHNTVDTLEAEGYELISADNGHTGLQLAIERPPDFIICDIMMPGLDGYSVLSLLQQNCVTCTHSLYLSDGKSREKGFKIWNGFRCR
jgi:CheY-like chemotaxis protein